MELPEDNTDGSENSNPSDVLEGTPSGHESAFCPESEYSAEPATDSVDMDVPRGHWFVEVVPGQVSDTANRISCAVDLLLAAADRPRE